MVTKAEVKATEAKSAVPEYLRGKTAGIDDIGKHVSVPRIKIVQAMSGHDFKEEGGWKDGDVVIHPKGLAVADPGAEFCICTIGFFPTWGKMSDIKDENAPMFVEETELRDSALAARCMIRGRNEEPYPEPHSDWRYRYVENLNYLVAIMTGPAAGERAILTLNRGDYSVGLKLNQMVETRAREDEMGVIWGNVFQLGSTFKQRPGKKQWWGFEICDPTDEVAGSLELGAGKYLPQKLAESMLVQKLHEQLTASHAAARVLEGAVDVIDEGARALPAGS